MFVRMTTWTQVYARVVGDDPGLRPGLSGHALFTGRQNDGQGVFVWSDGLLDLAQTSSLVTWSLYEMCSILR